MTILSSENISRIIFCGIDVGKHFHHLIALEEGGGKILNKKLNQDEREIRDILTTLCTQGIPIIVVDQTRNIGSLLVSICQDMEISIYYLSSLAMRRFADMHPGKAKTDARDAYMIARAAQNMPDILRHIPYEGQFLENLRMLSGFDNDLAIEDTMLTNRLRGILASIYPGLEHALAPYFDQKIVIELFARYGSPGQWFTINPEELEKEAKKHAPRIYKKVLTLITNALSMQTVVIPGTQSAGRILAFTAQQITAIRHERTQLEKEFTHLLHDDPTGETLLSLPGIGTRLGAKILTEIGDITHFPTQRHLAAYAGLSPKTHKSGTSIKGEKYQKGGNKRLKHYLYLAAFASLSDPASRTYYDKKRSEGKSHKQALLCLARQRCTTLHKMLTTNTPYQQKNKKEEHTA